MLPFAVVANKPAGTVPDVYDHQKIYLEGLATLRDAALQKRNDLRYAIVHPDEFSAPDVVTAEGDLNAQNVFLDQILKDAADCEVDPRNGCAGAYPDAPVIRAPVRVTSPASPLLAQIEDLYAARGDSRLVDAALALADRIDLVGATTDEKYHVELLRSELLTWKLNLNSYAGGSSSVDYKSDAISLQQALAQASALSSLLPSRPCEADYLTAKYNILQDQGVNIPNVERQLATLQALKERFTRDGRTCDAYDFHGISAMSAWGEARLAYVPGFPDADRMRVAASIDGAAAFAADPDVPFNFSVSILFKTKPDLCSAALAFAEKPTPAAFIPLDPAYTHLKQAALLPAALGCGKT